MKNQETIGNVHERTRHLIDAGWVEGLAPEERRWLASHLAGCEACAGRAAATEAALRAFRSLSASPPPGLAASTSLRVREKAAELKQQRARNLALTVGCTLSWMAGVASAPLVWKLFGWLGEALRLPRIVWELGFLCWWFVPAAFAGLAILWAQARVEREDSNGLLETGPRSDEQ
ncbi:MAG: hypothetical protein M1404_03225 [Acidobacteria bacterium]|nr:hypothetical protein [Acidobacteriota bacterium]